MLTYHNRQNYVATESKNYTLNEYFYFSIDSNNILLTTRHGGWAILSSQEYRTFKSNNLEQDSQLFKKLEEVGLVLTKRSTAKIISDLYKENDFLFRYPHYHVIAITNKCNLNCIYCHPESNPEKDEMDEKTARKVLDFIFSIPQAGGHQIVIEGGEPLLKWNLIKFIYKEANQRAEEKNLKLRFSFGTNLTLMNDKIAEELFQTSINPCTSLDGPKGLHDKQRPYISGQGTYDNTIYWIKRLKNKFKVNVHALPVITNLSLKFNPEEIIDEYVKIGQDIVFFKPFRPTGRALINIEELEMDPEAFYDFWERGVEYCLKLTKKGIKTKETNAMYFISNIFSPSRISMCHRRPCGAGISILSYNSDGTINGCDVTRGEGFLDLGHVDEDDYGTIRAKALPLLALSADSIPICSSCPFMAYCNVCLADTWGRESTICPKIPRSFSCKWQKRAFEFLFKKIQENKEDAQILRSWAPNR